MDKLLVALMLLAVTSSSGEARSYKARSDFVKMHACPVTQLYKMPCKGYVIDHIVPLCAGGADAPSNMQWQTYKESVRKDNEERAMCRLLKK